MSAIEASTIEVHPVAEFFPMMSGDEYDAFKENIRTYGLIKPIEVDRAGLLIDGRNRLRACEELGLEPKTIIVEREDLTSYIISCNLHRRQLNDVQRARVGEKIATRSFGQRSPHGSSEDLGHMAELVPTQEEVAKLLNVSPRQIRRARVVSDNGVPELNTLVDEGKVPLTTATRVAQSDTEDQQEFVKQVRSGASPSQVAPRRATAPAPAAPKRPPVYGTRRKHLEVLTNAVTSLSGLLLVIDEIRELDASVGNEEAARLKGGFSKAITGLNRINNLLKERNA